MHDVLENSPVTDSEIVYRRVPDMGNVHCMVVEEGDDGAARRRPSSANFKVKRDEDGLSVYRHDVLAQRGLDARALLKKPLSGVVSLSASVIRGENLDVVPDPWPKETDDPEHPRNAAHALVTGLESLSRNEAKSKAVTLAKRAIVVIDPTGATDHPG